MTDLKKENFVNIVNVITRLIWTTLCWRRYKMISIVILSYNDASYAINCVDSIQRNTNYKDYEIILINNGCSEGDTKLLETIKDVELIVNKENNGFPAGSNQGFKIALEHGAEFVYILNADTLVTENWLTNSVKAYESCENPGMIGAMSNYIANEWQDVENFNNELPQKYFEAKYQGLGFNLIPTKVLKEVGMLDEQFGYGGCEDLDYSYRLKKAGYKLWIDGFTFIVHKGGVANNQLPISYGGLQVTNRALLKKKWPDEFAWLQ